MCSGIFFFLGSEDFLSVFFIDGGLRAKSILGL